MLSLNLFLTLIRVLWILSNSCFFINHWELVAQGDFNSLKLRPSLGSTLWENGYTRFKRKVRAGGNDKTYR